MTTDQRFSPSPISRAGSEDEVLATIYSFDRFKIKKFVHRDITVLEVTGSYSPALGRKLEHQAAEVKNSLGLDFSALQGLQPSLLSSLQRLHRRLAAAKRRFLLCNPPDRLLDILKLNDVLDHFQIADSNGNISEPSVVSGLREPETDLISEDLEMLPVSREITKLNRSMKRTETLEKGLDSASECVRRLLPSDCPLDPDYDFAFHFEPCDKVGGDFFDFVRLDPNTLAVTIGDVSGHGLDSAIVMAMAKKVLRMRARDFAGRRTVDVLRQANRDLVEELSAGTFVTVMHARIQLRQGVVEFCRAGHEPLAHFGPGSSKPVEFVKGAGMALGVDSGPNFDKVLEESRVQLEPGDAVLLYTDGIVECWNARRDPYSRTRLAHTLEQMPWSLGADSIIQRINSSVAEFSGGTPQEDDMTAIAIKRH